MRSRCRCCGRSCKRVWALAQALYVRGSLRRHRLERLPHTHRLALFRRSAPPAPRRAGRRRGVGGLPLPRRLTIEYNRLAPRLQRPPQPRRVAVQRAAVHPIGRHRAAAQQQIGGKSTCQYYKRGCRCQSCAKQIVSTNLSLRGTACPSSVVREVEAKQSPFARRATVRLLRRRASSQ